jgi:hypothetical protein
MLPIYPQVAAGDLCTHFSSAEESIMRFAFSIRNVSLGLATAAIACGVALAQNNDSASLPGQSLQYAGANVRLDHAIDTRSAKPGEAVTARLAASVKAGGLRLDKGTQLVGSVTSVQSAANGGASSLAIAFTTAQLKNGKQIPVRVILIGAYPPSSGEAAAYALDDIPPAPQQISGQEKIDQQSGLLHNVAMHSNAQSNDSGSFTKKDGDLKIDAGTFFQVGIAPLNVNMTSSNGM